MKKTILYDKHYNLGAKILPFAGYSMPIVYPDGILSECKEVRNNVGIFDVSHMGQFRISGLGSKEFLQKLLINDITKLKVGDAQYTAMCNFEGGVIDDMILYKEKNSFLLIVNASNIDKNFDWMSKINLSHNVKLDNISDQNSLIAIQGPNSRKTLESILNQKISNDFYTFIESSYKNSKIFISRTGYTGELGFEIMASNKTIQFLWDAFIDMKVKPCGLASRDILRIEMKYCLYGNDMDESVTPYESNLGWITSLNKGDFIGKDTIIKKRDTCKLVGFKMLKRGIPRKGYEILQDNKVIGKVTSGTQSPVLNCGIGLARIKSDSIIHQKKIKILIRDKQVEAKLYLKPFIKKTSLKT